MGFSSFSTRAQWLWLVGSKRRLSSCGARALLLRDAGDLPGSGIEPVPSALAGRFFTTEPPGKPHLLPFFFFFCNDDCRDLCVGHTCFQAFSQSQALCGGQSEDGHDSRGPVLMKPLPHKQASQGHVRRQEQGAVDAPGGN